MKIIILTIVILGLILVFFGNAVLNSINNAEIIKNFNSKQADNTEVKGATSATDFRNKNTPPFNSITDPRTNIPANGPVNAN
ncbi:MAG: hypothetical protein WCX12_00115 [Candidatus Paceibacterota bacterium]|jgi:hypothetical protein